jgi:hypothetical protein
MAVIWVKTVYGRRQCRDLDIGLKFVYSNLQKCCRVIAWPALVFQVEPCTAERGQWCYGFPKKFRSTATVYPTEILDKTGAGIKGENSAEISNERERVVERQPLIISTSPPSMRRLWYNNWGLSANATCLVKLHVGWPESERTSHLKVTWLAESHLSMCVAHMSWLDHAMPKYGHSNGSPIWT